MRQLPSAKMGSPQFRQDLYPLKRDFNILSINAIEQLICAQFAHSLCVCTSNPNRQKVEQMTLANLRPRLRLTYGSWSMHTAAGKIWMVSSTFCAGKVRRKQKKVAQRSIHSTTISLNTRITRNTRNIPMHTMIIRQGTTMTHLIFLMSSTKQGFSSHLLTMKQISSLVMRQQNTNINESLIMNITS